MNTTDYESIKRRLDLARQVDQILGENAHANDTLSVITALDRLGHLSGSRPQIPENVRLSCPVLAYVCADCRNPCPAPDAHPKTGERLR